MTLRTILFGSEPKLHRMLQYWAATALLYVVCIGLAATQVRQGITEPAVYRATTVYGTLGVMFFYALVRNGSRFGIHTRTLAMLQALFAITCAIGLYAMSGPLRDATLAIPVVIVAFCTFSLRPVQTLLLAAVADVAFGAAMWWMQHADPVRYPPVQQVLAYCYLTSALLPIALLTGEMSKLRARLQRQKEELLSAVETIRTLATVDELTSLANRRRMNEVLAAEERRVPARGQSTCIAVLDIDFFKAVNDRYGHAAGDAVLRSFAEAARAELRGSDVLARWGGEEFLLMLPETDLAEANRVLNRMASRVAAMQVPGVALARRVSFSGGLAARREGESFADTINRADKALYQAKSDGRDRVITA
jgi:diguanylate cyclase